MSDDKFTPPTPTLADKAHSLGSGLVGSLPVVGNLAAEIFKMVVTPPIETRRQAWMERIGSGLDELGRKQKCVVEELKNNQGFVDTVLQATHAAIRTSQEEKLQALRNAVINSALPNPPDDSRRQIFLSMIDSFSVLHLRLLAFLNDPAALYRATGRQLPEAGFSQVALEGGTSVDSKWVKVARNRADGVLS